MMMPIETRRYFIELQKAEVARKTEEQETKNKEIKTGKRSKTTVIRGDAVKEYSGKM